jgi:hypothetical protein
MAGKHRNRARVRVRSFLDNRVLRIVSESIARQMCDEDLAGGRLDNCLPEAYRLSPKSAPLTDIRLLAAERAHQRTGATLSARDSQNNAFAKAFGVAGGPEISIRQLEAAEVKVNAWPEVHDYKAVLALAVRRGERNE